MSAAHAFAGSGSRNVPALIEEARPDLYGKHSMDDGRVHVDEIFARLGFRVRTELPTEEFHKPELSPWPPSVGDLSEPLPNPKWGTWLAIVVAVAAFLLMVVVSTALTVATRESVVPVRDAPAPAQTVGVPR